MSPFPIASIAVLVIFLSISFVAAAVVNHQVAITTLPLLPHSPIQPTTSQPMDCLPLPVVCIQCGTSKSTSQEAHDSPLLTTSTRSKPVPHQSRWTYSWLPDRHSSCGMRSPSGGWTRSALLTLADHLLATRAVLWLLCDRDWQEDVRVSGRHIRTNQQCDTLLAPEDTNTPQTMRYSKETVT